MAFRSVVQRFGRGVAGGLFLQLLTALWQPAAAQSRGNEEEMCTNDEFRLCSSAIPDVARVTVCMERNKALLSPGCRAFFVDDPIAEHKVAKGKSAKGQSVTAKSRKASVGKAKSVNGQQRRTSR